MFGLYSAFEISAWLDDKDNTLKSHYDDSEKKEELLKNLFLIAKAIKKSKLSEHNVQGAEIGWNNAINISRSLKGFKGILAKDEAVLEVLDALAQKIKESSCVLDGQGIGNALYGLQCMDATTPEVHAVLSALAEKITNSDAILKEQEIGNALYGLQCMDATRPEVRAVLSALAEKITNSDAILKAQNISNALYGLQCMDARTPEVRAVLNALAKTIAKSPVSLSAQGIGNALYGLQCMDATTSEVRAVLSALAEKITNSDAILKEQEIANALYGLQCMDATRSEVRTVLNALAKTIAKSPVSFSAQGIGNALYGLQCMNAKTLEVRALLRALTEKVMSLDNLDAQGIANALYGLQCMDAKTLEVRTLLRALTKKITISSAKLNTQEIGLAFYGLKNMSILVPEVKDLVIVIEEKIDARKFDEVGKNLFAWPQLVVGYLGLFKETQMPLLLVKKLLLEVSENKAFFSVKDVKTIFIARLTSHYYKNNILDLHGLDHTSAKLLVAACVTKTNYPSIIICGASTHCKSANIGIMHKIVKDQLDLCQLLGEWRFNNGRVNIIGKKNSQLILSSPTGWRQQSLAAVVRGEPSSEKAARNTDKSKLNPNAPVFIPRFKNG